MSADNGVFVLHTSGPEYRVAYSNAIDNIYGKFDDDTHHWRGDMDRMIDVFGQSKVYDTLQDAIDAAQVLSYDYEYLEYGVCVINDFSKMKFGQL